MNKTEVHELKRSIHSKFKEVKQLINSDLSVENLIKLDQNLSEILETHKSETIQILKLKLAELEDSTTTQEG